MASHHRAALRVVGEAEKRDTRGELPVDLFARAIQGATNDEALDLAYRLFENLAERAENASRLARDSGDRDAINEAFVFVSLVDKAVPHSFTGRAWDAWCRVNDAKKRVEKAQRSMASSRAGVPTSLEARANDEAAAEEAADAIPGFTDAEVIDALRAAIKARGTRTRRPGGAAWSGDVLEALIPGAPHFNNGRSTRATMRLAHRLSKLAKAGAIIRLRAKWGGANFWTLEGEQPDEYITKHYIVGNA